ncbi:MAG: dehydrogenase E1 component subunit alpha/beta [Bacteroidota bacterium]
MDTPHTISYKRKGLQAEFLLELYQDLLFPRMVEEKMLILLRQGRISKWFSGIGQEGISVGLTKALEAADYILPLHRNLGVFTTRKVPLENLIGQWLGKPSGFTQGRDRSFHFGLPQKHIFGMISHLGAMLPVADGLALASKLDKAQRIAVPFFGDGGSSEGDIHEALNVAAVWDLPVLFVVENNGYGLSTPTSEQFKVSSLASRAKGYGMQGIQIDGNNVLEVYKTVQELAYKIRETHQPILLECMTFRMRGHEEASGTKYIPPQLFETWKEKDPVENFEKYLESEGLLTQQTIEETRQTIKQQINKAVEHAFHAPNVAVNLEKELSEVYATPSDLPMGPPSDKGSRSIRFVDAIQEGLYQAMEASPSCVIMGQDVAEYGGVFKITEGFIDTFGKDRVRNTPLCESAIIGAGMGLSLGGKKAIVEMQFADFVSCGFNQIVNNLAKTHYRWGHAPDVVIRMPTGGDLGAGPYHSQSTESWFTHVPGLKVVFPSDPFAAKGLLISAIADPNPVMFFEHKALYRRIQGVVPEKSYGLPIGNARMVQSGERLSIVTYGLGVHWALELCHAHGYVDEIEIIDLQSLIPWDKESVFESIKKTGKCLVLYESTYTSAFGAEIAASVGQHCFEYLDGPVTRVGSLDTPVPFYPDLEKQFLPPSRLSSAVEELLAY